MGSRPTMPAAQQQVALPPRYRIVRHIANGGMAAVWAAEDELLERLVAVKVLAPGYAAEASARHRFTREARAAARVSDHPHVVTVYDIGETTTTPPEAFIVMEHFPGGTVAERLRADEPVPPPTALIWLEQAASALDAAHAADIVHRDVKPGNLLLDERGRLAVGDFGIASIAGETALTQAGQVLGTAAYLSPEQARGHAATPASDRYSLAVVAYELLCGRRPFGGDTPMAQARAHLEADPPTPTGPCEAAAEVLKHGLAKDPAARPETATAFVEALRRALGPLGRPQRLEEDPTLETRVTARRPRAAAAGAAGAGAAAAGAVAAAGAAHTARLRTPSPPAEADAPRPQRTGTTPPPPPRTPTDRREGGHGRRAVPLAGLAAACLALGAGAALLSDNGNGGSSDKRAATAERSRTTQARKSTQTNDQQATAQAGGTASQQQTQTQESQQTQPAPADGRSARELNDTGFAMLPGDPGGAIPLLERAVAGFRQDGAQGDINYAYSLYNLGWALNLAGRPDKAIPLLEERLRISDYKRGIVQHELRSAQRQAGRPGGFRGGDDNDEG